jgi:hypothetical protein
MWGGALAPKRRARQGILTERDGWVSTIDLLALTSSLQVLLILWNKYFYFTKQGVLTWRSTVLSLLLQQEFPGQVILKLLNKNKRKRLKFRTRPGNVDAYLFYCL